MKALNPDGQTESLLIDLQGDLAWGGFSARQHSALILAARLTQVLGNVADPVRAAVSAGWSNEEVAQIIFFTASMTMMKRIAQGFELPPDQVHPYEPEGTLPMLRCGP